MARQPGKRYPSDARRWFRLDSEGFAVKTAGLTDAEFRAFVLILAYANENKAQDSGDTITIAKSQIASVAPNRRHSNASATRVVRELCTKQTWEIRETDATVTIHVRNYSQKQGFAPTEPQRRPNGTPATTPTPTPTPNSPPSEEAKTPPKPDARESPDWVAPMLAHQSRTTDAERGLWLEAHWPEIVATAEIECPDGELLSKHLKRYAIRKWNTYVKTRDPSQRQFHREADGRAKAAAVRALDAQLEAQPKPDATFEPDTESDNPLRFVVAGRNPNAN